MQRARVKTTGPARLFHPADRRLAAHDGKAMRPQGFHQFAAAGAEMKNRAVGGVQPGFVVADDAFIIRLRPFVAGLKHFQRFRGKRFNRRRAVP